MFSEEFEETLIEAIKEAIELAKEYGDLDLEVK